MTSYILLHPSPVKHLWFAVRDDKGSKTWCEVVDRFFVHGFLALPFQIDK